MKTLEILLIIYTFCIVALSIVTYKFYATRFKYKEKYMALYNKYNKDVKESNNSSKNILSLAMNQSMDMFKKIELIRVQKIKIINLEARNHEYFEEIQALEKKVTNLYYKEMELQDALISKQYPLSGLCQKCIKTKKTK